MQENNTNNAAREIELKEHQKIMFDILVEFVAFCEKNALRYFLDAGTLLGAVRHRGFIPWDNDIDVCMMRKDYDRFIELVKKNNNRINDHLVLEYPEDTLYLFLKIGDTRTKLVEFPDTYPEECYVYIDVFPKDGIHKLCLSTKILCWFTRLCGLLHWFNKHSIPYWKNSNNKMKKLLATIMGKLVKDKNRPYRIQQAIIRRYYSKHPLNQCEYVTTLVNGEYNGCAPRACFDKSVNMQFEDGLFSAPIGYDKWMRILYGDDYMTPPPPEKQRVHRVLASWRDAKL